VDGMFRLSRGHVNNAYHEFETHLEEHNDSYEAMFGMAICLSVMDRADEARARLDEAIEIAPKGALEYHVYSDMLEALLGEGGSGR
jgi:Tfp pilus assembly protein PilF